MPDGPSTFPELPVDPNTWLQPYSCSSWKNTEIHPQRFPRLPPPPVPHVGSDCCPGPIRDQYLQRKQAWRCQGEPPRFSVPRIPPPTPRIQAGPLYVPLSEMAQEPPRERQRTPFLAVESCWDPSCFPFHLLLQGALSFWDSDITITHSS